MTWRLSSRSRTVLAAACIVAAVGGAAEADLGFGGRRPRPLPKREGVEHRVEARVVPAAPDPADETVAARIMIPRHVLDTLAQGRTVGGIGTTRTIVAGLALSAACIAVPFILRANRRTTATVAAGVALAMALGGWRWTQADVPPLDPRDRRLPGGGARDGETVVVFEIVEGEGPVVMVVRQPDVPATAPDPSDAAAPAGASPEG